MTPSNSHAPLPPSSAHCWVQCAGWRSLAAQFPQPEDDPKAMEGIAAHWAVAEVLSGRQIDIGVVAPNGIVLDTEMCEGADLMDDAIGNERSSLFVESRVNCTFVHHDNWGTPDAWRLHGRVLDVWDYKYGHRSVAAFENWQLLDYAAGILDMLGFLDDMYVAPDRTIDKIRLTIVQPRDYHSEGPVRTWELSVAMLQVYVDRLRAAARASDDEKAVCAAGAACRDCSASHACATLQAASLDYADQSYRAIPLVLDNTQLARQLAELDRGIELMQARRAGLGEQATATIKRGESVPGWMVAQGNGRERWNVPVDEVITLAGMMGVAVAKPGLITPKQAVKAGLPAEVVAGYTETPKGELKLVRDDGTKARNVFNLGE